MRILISNDDGYKAAGIHVLARVMAKFGDVTVVAPKFHQSAMSIAVSLGVKQLAYKEPVGHGHHLIFDLALFVADEIGRAVFLGSRHTDRTGTHSDDAGSAAQIRARHRHQTHRADADLSAVEQMLPGIIRDLLAKWPENRPGLYFNINFPDAPLELIKGVKWARQGHGHWIKEFEEWDERRLVELGLTDVFLWQHYRVELEPGEKAYFMKGEFVNDDNDPALADHLLVKDGWVTITPCVADLTDYTVLNAACPDSPCK